MFLHTRFADAHTRCMLPMDGAANFLTHLELLTDCFEVSCIRKECIVLVLGACKLLCTGSLHAVNTMHALRLLAASEQFWANIMLVRYAATAYVIMKAAGLLITIYPGVTVPVRR